MATTQLDIIRQQAEAAARNAVSRATGELRRDTSLVSQASRMTGKAFQAGEEALRGQMSRASATPPGGGRLCAPLTGAACPRGGQLPSGAGPAGGGRGRGNRGGVCRGLAAAPAECVRLVMKRYRGIYRC